MTPPRQSLRRRTKLLISLLLLSGITAGGWKLTRDYHAAWLREASLPELKTRAETAHDNHLLALLAYRQIQAHDYNEALLSLERAAESGNYDRALWQTWAATAAAAEDRSHAIAILKFAERDPKLSPFVKEALERISALPETATGPDLAFAISPEGPNVLQKTYGTPNYWSGILTWWGRRNPDRSGFETRQSWAKEQPHDPAIQLLWAQALAGNKRFPDAEPLLIGLMKKDPKNFDVALALADLRLTAGMPAKAGTIYRACVKERPKSFPAQLGLAKSAVQKKMIYIAMEAAQKAVELNPRSVEAWATLGEAYFNQKMRWDKACEAFARAQSLEPENLSYYGPYFDSLRLANRPEEAEKLIRRRLKQAPEDARAHYLLATILLDYRADAATEKEAESELRRSLELYPDSAIAQTRLGQLLIGRGATDEALRRLQLAHELDPFNTQALVLLARACRMLKRDADAAMVENTAREVTAYLKKRTPLEDARATEPMNVEIRKKLLELYRQGGEDNKAKQEEETIFMLENYPKQAESGLKSLMSETALAASTEWAKRKSPTPSKKP